MSRKAAGGDGHAGEMVKIAEYRIDVQSDVDEMTVRVRYSRALNGVEVSQVLREIAHAVADYEQNEDPVAVEKYFHAQLNPQAGTLREIALRRSCKSTAGLARLVRSLEAHT